MTAGVTDSALGKSKTYSLLDQALKDLKDQNQRRTAEQQECCFRYRRFDGLNRFMRELHVARIALNE